LILTSRFLKFSVFCGMASLAISGVRAQPVYDHIGLASWYGAREAGHRTASGAIFDPAKLSAAHRKLPLGSCVRVTRLTNRQSIVVPIIDRGPFVRGRLLDLSWAAAERLGMTVQGLAKVRIARISCVAFLSLQPVL
jgi:rare lipoprotein A